MKSMKFPLLTLVILSISALFYACSDDNDKTKPITLLNREDTAIELTYPYNETYNYTVQGGDGDYSVKTNNPEVVFPEIIKLTDVSASNLNLSLTVIGLGNAKVIITDKSQNSLTLDITVDYATNEYTVKLIDVRVTGGDLTENEKKAIIEKQIALNPVKIDGGYKFIFNDNPNKKGDVIIFANTYGVDGSKMVFNGIEYAQPPFPNSQKWGYELIVNNEKRVFVLGIYSQMIREMPARPMALIEDVTETVQKEYPKAESVIVYQVLKM